MAAGLKTHQNGHWDVTGVDHDLSLGLERRNPILGHYQKYSLPIS
jgi:hypothetical protein